MLMLVSVMYMMLMLVVITNVDDDGGGHDDGGRCLPVMPEKARGTVGQPEGE